MENKINFNTVKTYTLAKLFSDNYKIIIPDLQRDYCWGDETHTAEKKELVSDFVNNLIELFNDKKHKEAMNLGVIYGYEAPSNHIQLCDGQQRITTLFLLLGMLNKKTNNAFRTHLISDFEYKKDDKEPYLQYSIRESSLYFISDIVCHFFIKEENDEEYINEVKDIRSASWFFNEYNLDPTINSMINAIQKIENILSDKEEKWCLEFGEFLTSQLKFMYYDMENRKNGEETFVVINTTGEPLSNNQNLKPQLCNTKDEYEKWEEIETWFWNKRLNDNDTADAGFNEFLRWVTMLDSEKETLKEILKTGVYAFQKDKIKFDEINNYWEQVCFLFAKWEKKEELNKEYLSPKKNNNGLKVITQIDCFRLLPLIAYCKEHKVTDKNDRDLLRLYEFVNNLSRISNVRNAVNDLVSDVINIAKRHKDIIELLKDDSNISKTILSEEEKLKLSILKDNAHRNEIEEAFWEAQNDKEKESHKLWSGEILPLIEWSMSDRSDKNSFDINKFRCYLKRFDNVYNESDLDPLRRALLTRNLKEYPKKIRSNTNYSFCYEWSDWHTLIFENSEKFKEFFDDLAREKTYEQMIDEYNDMENEYYDFVKKDYLLKYCEQKNIQWMGKNGWVLIERQRATTYTSVRNKHLAHYLSDKLPKEFYTIECRWDFVKIEDKQNKDKVFYIKYWDNKWRFGETEKTIQEENCSDTIDFKETTKYEYENVLTHLQKKLEIN